METAPTAIYTLSLHDALPILDAADRTIDAALGMDVVLALALAPDRVRRTLDLADRASDTFVGEDRKSTRLNSSHSQISYAVFCLKKKNSVSPHAPGTL